MEGKGKLNLKSDEKKPFHCNWIKVKSSVLWGEKKNGIFFFFFKKKLQVVRKKNEMLAARNYEVVSKGGISPGYARGKSLDMGNKRASVSLLVSNWSKVLALLKQVSIYINIVQQRSLNCFFSGPVDCNTDCLFVVM